MKNKFSLSLFVLIIICWIILNPLFTIVKKITIVGNKNITEDEIVQTSELLGNLVFFYNKNSFKKNKLAPENLSRTLEDSGTVTSVLVPWNTCGAYHASVLNVATVAYLPFCFFSLISPIMTIIFAFLKIRIKKLAS